MPLRGDKQLLAKVAKLQKALQSTVPKRIGANAQRHFMESFRKQGFTDKTLQVWPKLKKSRTIRGKAVAGRILKGHGLLMNSIRVLRADWNSIQVAAGGPHVRYAQIHNEGGTIEGNYGVRAHERRAHPARTRTGMKLRRAAAVKAHSRKVHTVIPKRQFMGQSAVLDAKNRETILKTVIETLVK